MMTHMRRMMHVWIHRLTPVHPSPPCQADNVQAEGRGEQQQPHAEADEQPPLRQADPRLQIANTPNDVSEHRHDDCQLRDRTGAKRIGIPVLQGFGFRIRAGRPELGDDRARQRQLYSK